MKNRMKENVANIYLGSVVYPNFVGNSIVQVIGMKPNIHSNKIPDFIDLNAKVADCIDFSIYEKFIPDALRAIKKSASLPQEVIDYLTADGTFEGVLSKAGFEVEGFIDDDQDSLLPALGRIGFSGEKSGRLLKCSSYKEVLGKYSKKFMFAISSFVKPNSYIEFLIPYTGNYPQGEGSSHRWRFDGFQPDLCVTYSCE